MARNPGTGDNSGRVPWYSTRCPSESSVLVATCSPRVLPAVGWKNEKAGRKHEQTVCQQKSGGVLGARGGVRGCAVSVLTLGRWLGAKPRFDWAEL